MRRVPEQLLHGPFHRRAALASGLSARVLEGTRFVRVLPRVFCHRDHVMTPQDWVAAAVLALPDRARLTGITRIQQLGLDFGPRMPVRFVVEGDLHLAFDEIFLHRTKRLPPTDDVGVTPAAAYVAWCRKARVVDAVKVGDWLLHQHHTTVSEVRDLALAERWRDGASEALWVLDHLDGEARSLPESETRAVLSFSGLPVPRVNRQLTLDDDLVLIGDLVYEEWRTVVEYEGAQHQEERGQYVADLDRYAALRRHDIGYVQVTREKLRHARTLVGEVYRELLGRGYDGPPPSFRGQWELLFARIHDILAFEQPRRAGSGA
jgi:very-short-patch-repair endonuclease